MNQKSKKLKNIAECVLCAFAILASCAYQTKAQDKKKLSIGDEAPTLKYSKWIQGAKPITAIDPNKTYVVEFWATWCGPCIQAMPHLSELAKKYKGKVDFIGCNVLERVGNKPYESSLPSVTKFVQNQSKLKRMTYNVIADNNGQFMNKSWLDSAGIDGIPSSFVINKGVISWIGHPMGLDSVLAAINDDTFDINLAKEKYELASNKDNAFAKQFEAVQKPYQTAEKNKDYEKALAYTDSAMIAMPTVKFVFMTDKFRILLDQFGEDKAIAYGNEVMQGTVGVQAITGFLVGRDDLSQKMKEFSVLIAKKMDVKYPMVMEVIAKLQARAGFWKDAVESQQKTIEMAEQQKSDPNLAGFLTTDVINGYKKSLEDYKKNIK